MLSNREVDERFALNQWILGDNQHEFGKNSLAQATAAFEGFREQDYVEQRRQARLSTFLSLEAGSGQHLFSKYPITHVTVPIDHKPLKGGPWVRAATGKHFIIYQKAR